VGVRRRGVEGDVLGGSSVDRNWVKIEEAGQAVRLTGSCGIHVREPHSIG
jgi:hypothetical protein